MAGDLVEQPDVEASLLRPLTSAEIPFIATLLARASAQLRTAMRSIDDRIVRFQTDPSAPGAVDPEVAAAMLGDVIARAMVNPRRAASVSETEGPFSESTSYAFRGKAVGITGELMITSEDLAKLAPIASSPAGRPRSIKTKAALAPRRAFECERW